MNASFIKYESNPTDEDDAAVVATQLYEMHGYQKALQTVSQYIATAEDYAARVEWEKIAKELSLLSMTDQKLERAGLG